MDTNPKQIQGSPILSLLVGAGGLVLIVLGMRTAASILNPLFLALIFAFVFRPVLYWLEKKGLPPALAFFLTLVFVFVGVIAVLLFLAISVDKLVVTLPTYQAGAEQQQENFQSWLADKGIDRQGATASISISKLFPLFENIVRIVAQTLSGTFMMLFVFAFMLFESIGISKKVARIDVSSHPFVQTFANFGKDIRKYVTVLTGINFLVGAVDAVFLMLLGVDFPILWGLLAWLLGYIPSIGFWLALIPPVLLAYAEFGISKALLVFVGYVLINGSVQNIIQPKLMGDEMDLSPLAIAASLFIWTWIVGPLGALLAVPLTMGVQKLILQPNESSRWLAELMSAGKPKEPEGEEVEPVPEG